MNHCSSSQGTGQANDTIEGQHTQPSVSALSLSTQDASDGATVRMNVEYNFMVALRVPCWYLYLVPRATGSCTGTLAQYYGTLQCSTLLSEYKYGSWVECGSYVICHTGVHSTSTLYLYSESCMPYPSAHLSFVWAYARRARVYPHMTYMYRYDPFSSRPSFLKNKL